MSPHFDPSLLSDNERNCIKDKILSRTDFQINPPHCLLWTMSCSGSGYPQMKIGKVFESRFGSKPVNPAHILYAFKNDIAIDDGTKEISHLCHNKMCLNVDHLSYELKIINLQRKHCVSIGGACIGHTGYANCIFN